MLNGEDSNYRLTSMLGDVTFKPGPDMLDAVIQAVSANAQPRANEDTINILSSCSQEETIGVRALVAKYQSSKTILLVNCQFDLIPRELIQAETIYYLLPMIVRPKQSIQPATTLQPTKSKSSSVLQSEDPKLVVLRRYPRDFELYMDFGNGMQLMETASVQQVGRSGPSLEWIAERVRKQMDARSY
jgi:hypothetical protein